MRIISCDRCGKRIKRSEGIAHISIWYEDLADMSRKETIGEFHGWDFCMDCAEEIGQCIKIPLTFTTPDEGGDIADELEEELDAEPDIESEDEPINEPISEPIAELAGEPKEKLKRGGHPDSGRKPHIDWSKFKACVDAGKDNKWLAVEFGVEVENIPKWKWLLKDKISKGQIK